MLRDLVPAESAGFFWVDGTGAMQNLYAERMLPQQKMQLYFEHFYEGGEFDFKRNFLKRAKQSDPVSSEPVSAQFKSSAYYNEILRELDAHHVMHGIVRDHGAILGQLSLYRPPLAKMFSPADKRELQGVLHYVAHAVAAPSPRINGMNTHTMLDTDDDAMALIDADGRLLHASDAAKRLLIQAVDGQFSPQQVASITSPTSLLTELLKTITKQLLVETEALPLIVLDSRWGRITLRAYRLDDAPTFASRDAPIALRISRQEPMVLRFAHAMQSLNLSPQMQEIALHLAQGKSNAEIAAAMTVKPNTVNYHTKKLFSKLGTHGRDETVTKILSSQI
jgi:DNA-binding CsgD family transcriptional regulator